MRSLDDQPTIHEGVTARALKKKGIVSERCETNRQIRKDNALLRGLKEMVAEMMRKLHGSVNDVAERINAAWMSMVESYYHLAQIQIEKQDILSQLEPVLDDYAKYARIQEQISNLVWQRDNLIAQRKATPILQIRRRNELSGDIESLTRQIEGREQNKRNLLKARRYPSEKEMREVGKRIRTGNEKLNELAQRSKQHTLALNRGQEDYRRWTQAVRKEDMAAVSERLASFHDGSVNHLASKLKAQYGSSFPKYILQGATQDVVRWCAVRQVPERNKDERKSVRTDHQRDLSYTKQRKRQNRHEARER